MSTLKITAAGDKIWSKPTGEHHRLDGPAYEGIDGSKAWWVNGKIHRLEGPAIEGADGSKSWYVDNKLHRLDGPAIERADGSKRWYVDGQQVTETLYPEAVQTYLLKINETTNA